MMDPVFSQIMPAGDWLAEYKAGIGAALLSAHMSGPAFPEDTLPSVAGDLLTEVAP